MSNAKPTRVMITVDVFYKLPTKEYPDGHVTETYTVEGEQTSKRLRWTSPSKLQRGWDMTRKRPYPFVRGLWYIHRPVKVESIG